MICTLIDEAVCFGMPLFCVPSKDQNMKLYKYDKAGEIRLTLGC